LSKPIETVEVDITPVMAEAMLEKNKKNRKIRNYVLWRYTDDMVAGNWKRSHQSIALDGRGNILDGQHRLIAVVRSGKTVRMSVSRNVPPQSQVVMDDGVRRTDRDAFSLLGGEHANVNGLQIAITKFMLAPTDNRVSHTRQKTYAALNNYAESIEFADGVLQPRCKGVSIAPVGAAIARAHYNAHSEGDVDRIKAFATILMEGYCNTAKDHAAVRLRDWLLLHSSKANRIEKYEKTLFALRAFMNKEDIFHLRACKKDIYPLDGAEKYRVVHSGNGVKAKQTRKKK
jgi:hypothetical protein